MWSWSFSGQAATLVALLSVNSLCWTLCRYEENAILACTLLQTTQQKMITFITQYHLQSVLVETPPSPVLRCHGTMMNCP